MRGRDAFLLGLLAGAAIQSAVDRDEDRGVASQGAVGLIAPKPDAAITDDGATSRRPAVRSMRDAADSRLV